MKKVGMVRSGTDRRAAAAVGMAVALLAAVFLWYHATAFLVPAMEDAAALMDLSVDPLTLAGVQHRERTHCPRRARRLLQDLAGRRGLRAMMWREGATWVVVAGEGLSVSTGDLMCHYVPHRGPVTEGYAAGTAEEAPAGLVVRQQTTVDPSAISTRPNPIARYPTLAAAQDALPADTDTERHYIFVTGLAADPSAYVVRVMRNAPKDGLLPNPGGSSTVLMRAAATRGPRPRPGSAR